MEDEEYQLVECADFIEDGIRLLVATLAKYWDVEPCASCEGHSDNPRFEHPYVSFHGHPLAISKIKERIKDTGWDLFIDDATICEQGGVSVYTLRPCQKSFMSVEEIAERIKPDDADTYPYWDEPKVKYNPDVEEKFERRPIYGRKKGGG